VQLFKAHDYCCSKECATIWRWGFLKSLWASFAASGLNHLILKAKREEFTGHIAEMCQQPLKKAGSCRLKVSQIIVVAMTFSNVVGV
jgi:hypothetical protein